MIQSKEPPRRIVRSWAGAGTCETLYQDDQGTVWREVSEAEAQMGQQATCPPRLARRYPNGTIG